MNKKITLTKLPEPSSQPDHSSEDYITLSKRYVTRLRLQFLTPIALTLSLAVIVIIATVYLHEHRSIDSDIIKLQTTAHKLYLSANKQNARALQSVMDVLETDPKLAAALENRDRQQLLKLAEPIYQDLNQHYNITHFYFTGPDRVNLLRVHKPQKFGDTINRHTTLSAEKSGAEFHGIELGPLGTLTLRYVQPWYNQETQKLIGYVELGMEVDQTVNSIRSLFNIDIFVLIQKQYLQKENWEEGVKTFGGKPDWSQFPQMVLSLHGSQTLPDSLIRLIRKVDFSQQTEAFQQPMDRGHQYAVFQPIDDISGKHVGTMLFIVDTTSLAEQLQESVIAGAISVSLSAIFLIWFFYWLVGRIGKRMAENELKLEQMATHDSLTGLFNRRQFNLMLHDSIARHRRYKRPVALLMVDIDHFKAVNDTYGHPVGDLVLVKLSEKLMDYAREVDRVCRFGGEEFVILLPETNAEEAVVFAQRVCDAVAEDRWVIDQESGQTIEVTVSIGVATYQEYIGGSEELIMSADTALYTAKESGRNRVCSFGGNHPAQS